MCTLHIRKCEKVNINRSSLLLVKIILDLLQQRLETYQLRGGTCVVGRMGSSPGNEECLRINSGGGDVIGSSSRDRCWSCAASSRYFCMCSAPARHYSKSRNKCPDFTDSAAMRLQRCSCSLSLTEHVEKFEVRKRGA